MPGIGRKSHESESTARKPDQSAPQQRGCFVVLLFLALAAFTGCHTPRRTTQSPAELLAARTNYPAHWWLPVPTNGAPAWEIFPEAAPPGAVILSKRHELGLLSNFAATPFTFRGQRYASLEGFWQMMKYPEGPEDPRARAPGVTWPNSRGAVAQMIAFEANQAGRIAEQNMRTLGISWVTFEGRRIEYRAPVRGEFYKLVVAATWAKVRQNPEVRKVLLATGDLGLRPDHHQEPNAPPAWRYFEILTEIRGQLRREE